MKAEAKKMAREVKKRQRAKARIVRKVKDLSTSDIVHVLEQRAAHPAARAERASGKAGPSRPAAEPEAEDAEPESEAVEAELPPPQEDDAH